MANCVLLTLFIIILGNSLEAQNPRTYSVFDVRKSIPLNNKEKVYKDYYVNLGSDHGAQVGSILSVKRRVPVIDVYRNLAPGDLVVQVGKLKVIHVQNNLSVGRLVSVANQKNIPVVSYESIMMGDQVELSNEKPGPQDHETSRDQASVVTKKKEKKVKRVKVSVLDAKPAPPKPAPMTQEITNNPETTSSSGASALPGKNL